MRVRRWPVVAALWLATSLVSAELEIKSMTDLRTKEAIDIMLRFAERTGLNSDCPPRRYLWTDAFAVANFVGLAQITKEQRFTQLALQLVDQVHSTLARHRVDDARSGWISGLTEEQGKAHPTKGGLRIGKDLPERSQSEPIDEQLEWDQDGQYFHYLTKWMRALDVVARATHEPRYNLWARELAVAAHGAFTYVDPFGRQPRMYWKMSIDLSRPLVPSMGHHDPLDGYVTIVQLQTTAAKLAAGAEGPELRDHAAEFASMIKFRSLATADPLGIGGLLVDAYLASQLIEEGAALKGEFLGTMLEAAFIGLDHYARTGDSRKPAEYRLAFRELGLAIGLHAVARLSKEVQRTKYRARLEALKDLLPLGTEIESFWRNPDHQLAETWIEHRDINEVMLATSLVPDGLLVLPSPR